ncbi:MAG: response regulator [Deltaproteobacteria bacterium]
MASTRVLVADDDFELRAAVARLLSADGMTVQTARSGSEVLARLAEGGVDLLVTDVMMPDLGGVQAAAMARTAGQKVPILLMTARHDQWIAESVRKLQFASLIHKPFSSEELVQSAHALLERRGPGPVDLPEESDAPHLFPPALVPLLRKGVGDCACLVGIGDADLAELLSVVFFAGLETEEGERNPIRIVFVGAAPLDDELPVEGVPPPLYRWSTVRFRTPRSFSAGELVKLAAATTSGAVFVQVCHRDGRFVITGLSHEGVNLEGDPSLKIVVHRPGGLSIRMGRHHVLDYEHGHVQSLASGVILSGGPVRSALELASAGCGLPPSAAHRYLDVVGRLVAKLSSHGSGGILVFSAETGVEPPGDTGYRTYPDVSLAAMLLRLHNMQSPTEATTLEQEQLLAGAVQAEIQHTIVELGALTALDGSTILDRSLALVGFGIVLPVDGIRASVVEAQDVEATAVRPFDLGSRGTRHRAAVTYAMNYPGSVVFVASQDGEIGCLFRSPGDERVLLWRFRSAERHRIASTS